MQSMVLSMLNDPIKRKVRHQFNRAALTYDFSCSVQHAICLQAMQLLTNYQRVFNSIADFGCGTGESTDFLIKKLAFTHCYAIDFAEQLILVAKSKLAHINNIEWVHSDFELPITFNQPLDLIVCNMALHWSSDVLNTLRLWQTYLIQQGLLLFSVPMAGNFPELKASIKPNFLTDQEMTECLKSTGLSLVAKNFSRFGIKFANQFDALKALKATGANCNKITNVGANGLKPLKTEHIFINSTINQLTYELGIYLVRNAV